MNVMVSGELESTGYRCLFECVKELGIEPMMQFVEGVNNVSPTHILLRRAIMDGENDLLSLVKRNQTIIRYLRQHKKDFQFFSFTSENVYNVLTSLSKDISLLDLYIDNAKRLEALKVLKVELQDFAYPEPYDCDIYRDKYGKIIVIVKYYTDGQIKAVGQEVETDPLFHYSKIPFTIENKDNNMSFVLRTENNEQGYQFRSIKIRDFGFDGTKLPSEEELQTYEIPKQLILK